MNREDELNKELDSLVAQLGTSHDVSALADQIKQVQGQQRELQKKKDEENKKKDEENKKKDEENKNLRVVVHEAFQLMADSADSRALLFSEVGSNRTPPFRQNSAYWATCLHCGVKNNVTRAHLMTNADRLRKEQQKYFGLEAGYASEFDGFSERNHIPLCGTLGKIGTCHHNFDSGKLTLVYNPFSRKYFFYELDKKLHEVQVPKDIVPYRRVLAWRARHDAIRRSDIILLRLATLAINAQSSDYGTTSARKSRKRGREEKDDDSWDLANQKNLSMEDSSLSSISISEQHMKY
jgi:hypothetical protein